MPQKKETTSWESVSSWYDKSVGKTGQYYHEHVILPKSLEMLKIKRESKISCLDLACGQGILARALPKNSSYVGVDLSDSLITAARSKNTNPLHTFCVGDITERLSLPESHFSLCTIILALQNIRSPLNVFENAYRHMKKEGNLLIVMNHPCFRIPRQSSWEVDLEKKIQYRRIDRYLSPLKIPIQAHPSQGNLSKETISFHYPISSYTQWLHKAGFVIEMMDEWCSDKKSTGKHAKMEDICRSEFPLFLAILAKKL